MEVSKDLEMVKDSRMLIPKTEKVEKTNIGSVEVFGDLLKESLDKPEKFWSEVAKGLFWYRPWEKVIEGDLPNFKFFVGGISNPAYNMLDININKKYGNKLALIWEGENYETRFYTYNMLLWEVNKFCNVLKDFGIKKGDRVAMYLPNFPETVIAVLACYKIGAIFNTIFSGFSGSALKDRLSHFEPQIVITADGGYRKGRLIPLKEQIDAVLDSVASIRICIVVKRTGNGVYIKKGRDYWLDELVRNANKDCEPELLEANEPGLVSYTSGTTGKPKGVVHSGNTFVVGNYIYAKYHLDLHPDDVFWCMADVGWLTMHIWGIIGAFTNGITSVFYEGSIDYPLYDRAYQIIEKYRITKWLLTPSVARFLMRLGDEIRKPYDLSSLDVIAFVGEQLKPEVWNWIYEKIGNNKVYINNTYGQTETGGSPLANAAWLTPTKPGSCGIQFFGAQMDIVDNNGKPVPPMTLGNLIMRKPIPMLARTLWKDHESYLETYFNKIPNVYFTYDIALRDNDGHYWVLGRTNDVNGDIINIGGHKLSAKEIENTIMEIEGIMEVAVIGAPDNLKGMVPIVLITTKEGYDSDIIKERIKGYVVEKISKIAKPAHIFNVPAIPKTISGKVAKKFLRELITSKGDIINDTTFLENDNSIDIISKIIKKEINF